MYHRLGELAAISGYTWVVGIMPAAGRLISQHSCLEATEYAPSLKSSLQQRAIMQPGVYKFINRLSGTAMALDKQDYTSVVGSPPCGDSVQKWEIAPLGAGYTIRNMQTGTHLSVKELCRGATIFAGHFPTAWQFITVKVDDENAEMIEYFPFQRVSQAFFDVAS
ncbi:uncharacterized protein F5891DRAFT_1220488 [Suillus fuscotomentosus]|uniref:Ricin B lectin domain-containing protein n=1 Tax=Suillus fuscotomentosus TaxID=1912939 RepID=A0AAD4EKL0_9AGAM|nr:uncharacterized protein F5891DRAFT_1220488 [Suillus fuscotomentosus]KAG1907914.1 hypothetical protein F5891DRAFT_1220488 [Suillus fuscotomentosus]